MDDFRPFSGFNEVPHTADIAVDVFAPNLNELFIAALRGLYHILAIRKGTEVAEIIRISMEDVDEESLLVSFLNEMLFYVEKDLIADEIELSIGDHKLEAKVEMHPKISQQTDIKAATFNNLKIIRTDQGLRTRIVFDA